MKYFRSEADARVWLIGNADGPASSLFELDYDKTVIATEPSNWAKLGSASRGGTK